VTVTSTLTTDTTLCVRLYVAGHAPNSAAAVSNLKAVLARRPNTAVDLEIIDVVADPGRALREGIFITPMLVRLAPTPERRVLGNLQNRRILLDALGFDQEDA
jgi:circadian clock protein KaiB